ncbi:MAG: hypothetical protein IT442_15665 [Phycisphaeraceae bacterium]|nr:hypothetical protein [Phycisphaeraceae bacterium]
MRALKTLLLAVGLMLVALPAQAGSYYWPTYHNGCGYDPCPGTPAGPTTATFDFYKTTITVTFVSEVNNTWTYQVQETKKAGYELWAKDLRKWEIILEDCAKFILGASPTATIYDETIKWYVSSDFTTGLFSFTLSKDFGPGTVDLKVKVGDTYKSASIYGPDCCEVQLVPTPAAAWGGLTALAGLALAHARRKRA